MVVHPAVTLEGAQSRVTAVAPAATEKQKKGLELEYGDRAILLSQPAGLIFYSIR